MLNRGGTLSWSLLSGRRCMPVFLDKELEGNLPPARWVPLPPVGANRHFPGSQLPEPMFACKYVWRAQQTGSWNNFQAPLLSNCVKNWNYTNVVQAMLGYHILLRIVLDRPRAPLSYSTSPGKRSSLSDGQGFQKSFKALFLNAAVENEPL